MTPKQKQLLGVFSLRPWASYSEVLDVMGIKSKSGIHRMVKCLEERGYITRIPGKARSIELTQKGKDHMERYPEIYDPNLHGQKPVQVHWKEFLGPVALYAAAIYGVGIVVGLGILTAQYYWPF